MVTIFNMVTGPISIKVCMSGLITKVIMFTFFDMNGGRKITACGKLPLFQLCGEVK
jgi:hypothetical protein